MIWARSDEIPIHRPLVVLAKGETVGGVVVLAFRKRNEMGGEAGGAEARLCLQRPGSRWEVSGGLRRAATGVVLGGGEELVDEIEGGDLG